MTDLPSRVQIGPFIYTVTEDESAYNKKSVDEGAALWGHIAYGKSEITVNPDQGAGHKRMSLLHEVLHGVWHLHDVKHESDEELLRSMTASLLDTLRRNPDLVAYLLATD